MDSATLLTSEFPSSPFLPSVGPSIKVFIYRLISEIFLPGLIADRRKSFRLFVEEKFTKSRKGSKTMKKNVFAFISRLFCEISSRLGTWARTQDSFPATDSGPACESILQIEKHWKA